MEGESEHVAKRQLAALAETTLLLDGRGFDYWLFGGWAVDFHVGRVTREHSDIDLAVWLHEAEAVASLLRAHGWQHKPGPEEDGGTGYERGGVRLELTFIVSDGEGRVMVPLRNGPVAWSEEPLGSDARDLLGVSARVIAPALLEAGKSTGGHVV
jgi:hypothetical protein